MYRQKRCCVVERIFNFKLASVMPRIFVGNLGLCASFCNKFCATNLIMCPCGHVTNELFYIRFLFSISRLRFGNVRDFMHLWLLEVVGFCKNCWFLQELLVSARTAG